MTVVSQANTYFDQALQHLAADKYDEAIELLTRALRLSLGDLARVHLHRGIAYAYQEQYEAALDDFNDALRRNPYLTDAYNERGNVMRIIGDYEQAIADYGAALHLEEDHYAAYYNRALAYEHLRHYSKAEADLDKAIALKPDIVTAYEIRGRIRARQHRYDEAIADLETYLQMGGGQLYDNHSDTQSYILNLRLNKFLSRFIPPRFLPGHRTD
jgi:tetratricopeptide (TPR) repeat protein